jgi:hypothetical protein
MQDLVTFNEYGDDDNFGAGRTLYGVLSCVRFECGGFVQVSSELPAGATFEGDPRLQATLRWVAIEEAKRRGWIVGARFGQVVVAYCDQHGEAER